MVRRFTIAVLITIVGALAGLFVTAGTAAAASGNDSVITWQQGLDLPGGASVDAATFQNPAGVAVTATLPYIGYGEALGAIGPEGALIITGSRPEGQPGGRQYVLITPDGHMYTGNLPMNNAVAAITG